ncbi:MAG: hypothetical protein Q8K82_12920 [Gemmatimonadaceae bacterium]|nr:hypothetical protein [Gemmatimonadaceae bacterium]
MAYQSSLAFDTVLVIESLAGTRHVDGGVSEPWLTGRDLFETTIRSAVDKHSIVAEYFDVADRQQFFGAIRRAFDLAQSGRAPILHFEMHGDAEGLTLASGDHIAWDSLAPKLAQVNQACRMNLLVIAAACEGWYLTSSLHPTTRSPVWGVLGPPKAIEAGALREAIRAFYQVLFSRLDLRAALGAMNDNHDITDWTMCLVTADIMFCRVFRAYIAGLDAKETQEQRVNRLVSELAVAQQMDVSQTMVVRAEIAGELSDHQTLYDKYRQTFLLLDLFPENAARFPMAYADCIAGATETGG